MSVVISSNSHVPESTHWYTQDGLPKYTVIGKNGKTRNTTLKDAREKKLLPSVTSIIKCAACPGLDIWKQQQVLLSALTLTRDPFESEADFIKRVLKDSKETGRKAAERGTAIHTAAEGFYNGLGINQYPEHITGLKNALNASYGATDWIAEKSFGAKLGFGGKTDLCAPNVVIDIKTKEFDADNLPEGFDEHCMQLAAYRVGLGMPNAKCGNAFISVTNPGLVHVVVWAESDIQRGWNMFNSLLDFWYAKSGLSREA